MRSLFLLEFSGRLFYPFDKLLDLIRVVTLKPLGELGREFDAEALRETERRSHREHEFVPGIDCADFLVAGHFGRNSSASSRLVQVEEIGRRDGLAGKPSTR